MVNIENRIRKRRKLLIGFVIVLTLFFIIDFGLTQSQIPQPISYDFYDNTLLESNSFDIPDMYNIDDNIETYTGNYLATYSFDNVNDITDYNGFTTNVPNSCSIDIIDSYNGHDDVLQIYDGNSSDEVNIYYDISGKSEIFSISFWQLSYIAGNQPAFYMKVIDQSANRVSILRFHSDYDDQIDYYDSTGVHVADQNYMNNTWANYYLEFDYTNDVIYFYINYIYKRTYDFELVSDDLDYIEFYTRGNADDLTVYLDGIDVSFDSDYFYQRNFIPEIEKQPEYQMDNFEFDYSEQNFLGNATRFKVFDDTLEQIGLNQPTDIQSEIQMSQNPNAASTYYTSVIWNTDLESKWFTYTCTFEVALSNDLGASTTWYFKFDDNPDEYQFVVSIFTYADDHIRPEVYSRRITDYYHFPELEFGTTYTWNVIVNLQDNYFKASITGQDYSYSVLDYFSEDNFESTTMLEYIKVQQINHVSYDYDMIIFLENMNIKNSDGYNAFTDFTPNEYGMLSYYLDNLDLREHNLITIDFPFSHEVLYYPNLAFYNGIKISEYPSESYEKTYNLYSYVSYTNTYLSIKSYGNFTLPDLVKVSGVGLKYKDKLAIPTYYYSNVNYSNYYYVDGNRLYYNFSRHNQNQNETMSMRFLVDDYYVYNESFKYQSYITNDYNGTITIYDSDLGYYESFNFTEALQTSTYELSTLNNTNVNEIWISIGCFDDNYANGYAEGYLTNLDILPTSSLYEFDDIDNLELDFTDGLIYVAIRLAMFLIPTFVIVMIFGYKGLVPIWLLMLIIYFLFSVIPFWMCAIQSIALLLMMIIPKKERDD